MSSTRRLVLVALAAPLAGCAGFGGDSTTGERGTTAQDGATDARTATVVDEGADTYALGEPGEIEQEDRTITVRVDDYRFAAAFAAEADDGTDTRTVDAPDGEQFLFVQVTVENEGDTDGATPAVAVRPNIEAVDVESDPPADLAEGIYRSVRELEPGATTTGWLAVRVDADVDASDVRVAFSPDILVTSDEYRWTLENED